MTKGFLNRIQGKALFCLVFVLGLGGTAFADETADPGELKFKYEEPSYLSGAIYARDHSRLLFNFKRVASRVGGQLDVQRDFTYPDGKLAAHEHVLYKNDGLALYELEQNQTGAAGRVQIECLAQSRAIDFKYTRQNGRVLRHAETWQPSTLIADMIGPFLVSHWSALARGDKVKCRVIVVSRAQTIGFNFVKDSETTRDGQPVLVVKMAASSLLVAALVDPLLFTIEQAPPHRVLEYSGRTTPKIKEAGKWKDLDAVTVFDWKTAR